MFTLSLSLEDVERTAKILLWPAAEFMDQSQNYYSKKEIITEFANYKN